MDKNEILTHRDISWLAFNHRVLQEAADKNVPLIERLKFLGIFSNNLDEFFRVRVATIKREEDNPNVSAKSKKVAHHLIERITDRVIELQDLFNETFVQVEKLLEGENIFIINESELTKLQQDFVKKYFHDKVRASLVPIMLSEAPNFPYLKDRSIYLAIKLSEPRDTKTEILEQYSVIQLPTDVLPRFIELPKVGDKNYIILLDDVIRFCTKEIYAIFNFQKIEAFTIKITRDAELELDNDFTKSYTEKLVVSLKKRKRGKPVRLNYDEQMPQSMLNYIVRKLKMKDENNVIPGGRYHNFRNFIQFPHLGKLNLLNDKIQALIHSAFEGQQSLLNQIIKKDVLLSFPYHSFNNLVDVLREAAIDPTVESIKITLYRVAEDSAVAYTLLNAMKNGKRVYVIVELQARFDEENNIYWANKLQEEGAIVKFGIPGLKIHSKLILITKRVENKLIQIASIGTGNFNEKTSQIYTDYNLLTANETLTKEVATVFNFFQVNYQTGNYTHLLVAPFSMRLRFEQLIAQEITNAKKKLPASLFFKFNNLEDEKMIHQLYEASKAGVTIKLIVRGICCLKPGIKGLSENIEIISIIDQFLEHARVFIFHNNGNPKMFISSADLMTRNLDIRTEVATPIYEKHIFDEILNHLNIQWSDNVKARKINQDLTNEYVKNKKKLVRSQLAIYNSLKK